MDMRKINSNGGRKVNPEIKSLGKWYVQFTNTGIIVDAFDRQSAHSTAIKKIQSIPHPDYCYVGLSKPEIVKYIGGK